MSESIWKRIESSRARHNVLEHLLRALVGR